jgi:glycosyltransferase involved in cell wall biosynthesis
MISTPLVTVAIPTLRRPAYLREALASVLAQTYANLQIIVSNDAAGDETAAAVREFTDPRIVLLENTDGPRGIVTNFNRALAAATGTYFVLVCHDDRIGPTFVESMVELFEGRDDVMVGICPQEVIDEHGAVLRRLAWTTDRYLPGIPFVLDRYNDQHQYVTLISAFFRTAPLEDIGGFPPFAGGEHSENGVMIRLAARGVVGFAERGLFQYRVYEASSGLKAYRSIAQASSELLDYLETDEIRAAYGRSFETLRSRVAKTAVRDYHGRIRAYFIKDHSTADTWSELIRHGLLADRRLRVPYLLALPRTLLALATWRVGLSPAMLRKRFTL